MRYLLVLFFALLTTPVFAQGASPYAPPDEELWGAMIKAFDELPVSKSAHGQIDMIAGNVQRAAQARKAQAQAEKPDSKVEPKKE